MRDGAHRWASAHRRTCRAPASAGGTGSDYHSRHRPADRTASTVLADLQPFAVHHMVLVHRHAPATGRICRRRHAGIQLEDDEYPPARIASSGASSQLNAAVRVRHCTLFAALGVKTVCIGAHDRPHHPVSRYRRSSSMVPDHSKARSGTGRRARVQTGRRHWRCASPRCTHPPSTGSAALGLGALLARNWAKHGAGSSTRALTRNFQHTFLLAEQALDYRYCEHIRSWTQVVRRSAGIYGREFVRPSSANRQLAQRSRQG